MYFWRARGGVGSLYKCAYKGVGGALGRLRSGGGRSGGRMGSGILESEFELYSVNCIAAKSPGCQRYM